MENNRTDLEWWQSGSKIPIHLNDVPMFENNSVDTKNSEFRELSDKIDKLVYEFITEHSIDGWYGLNYSIDDLEALKEYGVDTPLSDRELRVVDRELNTIMLSR